MKRLVHRVVSRVQKAVEFGAFLAPRLSLGVVSDSRTTMKPQSGTGRHSFKQEAKRNRRLLPCSLVLGLCLTLGLAVPAGAQLLVRQVNLAELTQRAAIIVQGRVVEASYEGHPDYPNIPTVRVTLEVERMLRGAAVERFTFREVLFSLGMPAGGAGQGAGPAQGGAGKRGYAAGQRLLLFLPVASRYGLSSPLGMEQGRFRIFRDPRGVEQIVNDFGNAGLFRHVSETAAQRGIALTPEQARVARVERGAVPLEDFLSLVERLTSLPRLQ